jgi:hypothetical protein
MLVFCINPIYSAHILYLKKISKPQGLEVHGNSAFVVEGATIYVYSTTDKILLRKFGHSGEGPGELKIIPFLANSMTIFPDFITFESVDKIIYFSKSGKLIKEEKKSILFTQKCPVGKNFVVRKRVIKNKTQYSTINFYNPITGELKELHRQIFGGTKQWEVNMIPDAIHFRIYQDKIFIEKSPEGFIIDVYDSFGNKLYRINNPYKKISVTDDYKKKALRLLKEDPFIKNQHPGFWETFEKKSKFLYPDSFPAIQDFVIDDDKIYVQTFNKKNKKEQYTITDLKGRFIKHVFLPTVKKPGLTEQMMGTGNKTYSIHNSTFYYLVENNNNEEWEVHMEEIRSDKKK